MNHKQQLKIGITGQQGFIGYHLTNYLGLLGEGVQVIPCLDDYFSETGRLQEFVKQCDVIIHLAALNRHASAQTIYEVNVGLVDKLIDALEETKSTPHLLFASSTQEDRDNEFGRSKREGRKRLADWAQRNKALFTGLIIPNVYGPFGKPFYNSVVSTFCYQACHNQSPVIQVDAKLNLIYINELAAIIWAIIDKQKGAVEFRIPHSAEKTVSEIDALIKSFRAQYLQQGIIPLLSSGFEQNLFNSFMCYNAIDSFYPVLYKINEDSRGRFVELLKTAGKGQVSFSTTQPGITRGNHFHTRKIERFSVIKGKALIRLRRVGTQEVITYELDGASAAYVDIPVWYTHNITNIGDDELYTVFWINEFFNSDDPDTYYQEVQLHHYEKASSMNGAPN